MEQEGLHKFKKELLEVRLDGGENSAPGTADAKCACTHLANNPASYATHAAPVLCMNGVRASTLSVRGSGMLWHQAAAMGVRVGWALTAALPSAHPFAEREHGWVCRSAGDAGGTSRRGDSKKRKSTGMSGPLSSKARSLTWTCLIPADFNDRAWQCDPVQLFTSAAAAVPKHLWIKVR